MARQIMAAMFHRSTGVKDVDEGKAGFMSVTENFSSSLSVRG